MLIKKELYLCMLGEDRMEYSVTNYSSLFKSFQFFLLKL